MTLTEVQRLLTVVRDMEFIDNRLLGMVSVIPNIRLFEYLSNTAVWLVLSHLLQTVA